MREKKNKSIVQESLRNGHQKLYAMQHNFPAEKLRVESAEEAETEDDVKLYWTKLVVETNLA